MFTTAAGNAAQLHGACAQDAADAPSVHPHPLQSAGALRYGSGFVGQESAWFILLQCYCITELDSFGRR